MHDINQLQGQLMGSTHAIENADSLQSEMDALLQNVINISAIEGEQLNVDSVRSSLAKRLGMNHTSMPPGTAQTEGLTDLILDATRNPQQSLTEARLSYLTQSTFSHREE